MDGVKLTIDEGTFKAGAGQSSSFTGSIYFDFSDKFFPEKNVLHMWTENVLKLLKDSSFDIQLHFLDGPFIVRGKLDGVKLALGFFEQKYDEEAEDLSEVLIQPVTFPSIE